MNSKKCGCCEEIKLLSEFNWRDKSKRLVNSYCRQCSRAYSKNHFNENKQDYFKRRDIRRKATLLMLYKLKSAGCTKCEEKDPRCIDFHHINKKNFAVSTMCGWNQQNIIEEISKCIRLCSNCHRKEHINVLEI